MFKKIIMAAVIALSPLTAYAECVTPSQVTQMLGNQAKETIDISDPAEVKYVVQEIEKGIGQKLMTMDRLMYFLHSDGQRVAVAAFNEGCMVGVGPAGKEEFNTIKDLLKGI